MTTAEAYRALTPQQRDAVVATFTAYCQWLRKYREEKRNDLI